MAKLLKEFNEEKVDAVVLDLRQNGGGSLTESINLTGLFIDTGPVVQVKDSDKRVQHYDDTERGMAWTGPLVVLTSKFSASASEIFAGAIQDYQSRADRRRQRRPTARERCKACSTWARSCSACQQRPAVRAP